MLGRVHSKILLLVAAVFFGGPIVVRWLSGESALPPILTYGWNSPDSDVPYVLSSNEARPNGSISSIGKVTMLFGKSVPIYEQALALQLVHNRIHGYPMSVLREQLLEAMWSKPAYILGLLVQELAKPEGARLKWLFWFDGDIVLMNPRIPLEIFLPPEPKWSHIHLVAVNDHKRYLNNGAFFLRVNDWSVWLMSAILSYEIHNPDVVLRTRDQGAMQIMIASERFRNGTMHVPQRWFNAYTSKRGNYYSDPRKPPDKFDKNGIKEGDLLVHFAGHSHIRHALMSNWVEVAELRLDKWEVPLNETTYPMEIANFWKGSALKEEEHAEEWKLIDSKEELEAEAKLKEAQHV